MILMRTIKNNEREGIMKRFKSLVIGGIQSKVVSMILATVILLTSAYMAVSMHHSSMLVRLTAESENRQQGAIEQTASSAMDQLVEQVLQRSNRAEARIADEMFDAVRDRVTFLGECTTNLFAHSEDYVPKLYHEPNPSDDGTWTAKVIYADGVDSANPVVTAKLGLLANMSNVMVALCPSFGAANVYIALPEGVHLSVSDSASSWFVDGKQRVYDPRERGWYRQAVAAGTLIFTDGEYDANTGAYCIECAMPVYGPEGSLQAVIGADLYLDEMQAVMQESAIEGEYFLLVNQSGHAVLAPQEETFPLSEADRGSDLRGSRIGLLAKTVDSALRGSECSVALGQLADGAYYITATPIETTGWVLVSAYSQATAGLPLRRLQESLAQIQSETTVSYQDRTVRLRAIAAALLTLVGLLTLGGALVLGKRIVTPLNTITQRISELNGDNLEFRMDDRYRTGDEVEVLAESFAAISRKTIAYMDTVKRVTAEKERIGAELALATRIQADMLPHVFPPFPNRSEFDIFATMDPAKEVGGDFYDYFLIDDDHLCMVIADVSGKGVPAALFMMASKIIVQSIAMLGNSPAEILTKTNEAICKDNEAQMFVTVWLGILELSTGRLTAANAGHEYPVLKQPNGKFELYKDKHGIAIGAFEGVCYKEYEIQLEPGSKLFAYTDGVPEATNAEREFFGIEPMIKALNETPDVAPQVILKVVRTHIDSFVKDAEQFDDLTMLCIEYRGNRIEQL